ncbi:MAG: helicase, partial [Actinomycetota bacterium]|nr:helicase [Actinomycetota bacterium]
HAIRKNVATAHRAVAFGTEPDPWQAMFEAADATREAHHNEVVPYWVYPVEGGARIERYVPALPLSRDAQRLEELHRSLAAYRLVFGQPRQDDLVAFLQDRFDVDQIRHLLDELAIDLTPRAGR